MAQNSTDLLSYNCGRWKSDTGLSGLKSVCWQGCILSGVSWGESFFYFAFSSFYRSLTSLDSWCPFIFKANNGWLSPHIPSLWRWHSYLPLLSLKNLCDDIGPAWIIQDRVPILGQCEQLLFPLATFLSAGHVREHVRRFWFIRTWTSLGRGIGLMLPPTTVYSWFLFLELLPFLT